MFARPAGRPRSALGSRRLAGVTPLDVQQIVNEMAATLAPATVRTNYGVLRAALNAAVDDGRIARTPCRRITLPRNGDTKRRALEPTELHRLAGAMPIEYRALVYVGGVAIMVLSVGALAAVGAAPAVWGASV